MKLKSLEKKFHQDPKKNYFFPLANAYREIDRLDDCIKIFRQGISLFPDYWSARVALGRALFEKGDIDEALKELETASVHVPENFLLHELFASIYLKKGDLFKAAYYSDLVLFVNPNHAIALRIKEEVLKTGSMDSQKDSFYEQEQKSSLKEQKRKSLPEKPEKQEDETGFVIKEKDEEKESLVNKEEDQKESFTQERQEKKGEEKEEKERESFPLKQDEEIITATLAELYISQGLPEKAIEIYQKLIKQQPEREEEWKKRIAAIQEIQGAAVSTEIFASEAEAVKKKNTHESIVQQLETWLKNIEKFEKST